MRTVSACACARVQSRLNTAAAAAEFLSSLLREVDIVSSPLNRRFRPAFLPFGQVFGECVEKSTRAWPRHGGSSIPAGSIARRGELLTLIEMVAAPRVAESLRQPRQSQSLQHSLHLAIECGRTDRWLECFQSSIRPQLEMVNQCVARLLLPANQSIGRGQKGHGGS